MVVTGAPATACPGLRKLSGAVRRGLVSAQRPFTSFSAVTQTWVVSGLGVVSSGAQRAVNGAASSLGP